MQGHTCIQGYCVAHNLEQLAKGGGLEKDVRTTVVYTSSVRYSYCEAKLPYNDTGTEV